jgi:superfamily II DNA or RNA helicase
LNSIEDDAHGEELRVVWEIEPGARPIERAGLPAVKAFDDPERLKAFLSAVRWGAITNADKLSLQAPFRSGISIEAHQLDPLVRALEMSRVNLLIADDVGFGKTIEAGLVMQELLLRHRARNVLIIVPASLQLKWQVEMLEKFGLDFRIVDTQYVKDLRRSMGIHANPWTSFPRLITSMQWLRNDIPMRKMREVLPAFPTYPRTFDILVVDEAHNIAPAGSGNYSIDSQQTRAIREIAPHFEHRLFLTATPHNGYKQSFTALLEILDDQRFARGVDPEKERLARVMVRRLKTELVDEDSNPIYKQRLLKTLEVDYSEEEKQAHADLVEYSKLRAEAVKGTRYAYATTFVLKTLKKRMFSSPAAFVSTLHKHLDSLAGRSKKRERSKMDDAILRRAIVEADSDWADDERREAALEEATIAASTVAAPLSDRERELLNRLKAWGDRTAMRVDAKAKAILDWLHETIKPGGEWSDQRVILFTEYRITHKWLFERLTREGFAGDGRLSQIYGGMDSDERERVKAEFQEVPSKSAARILLATDAASEGIDLQLHCHRMIHVEIPWNPNVLEQRNGRIDRFGQTHDVHIYHPIAKGFDASTIDPQAEVGDLAGDLEFLMRVVRKVNEMRNDLGAVSPVIAAQVEEAMRGDRKDVDTAAADAKRDRSRRALAIERNYRERVARLHQRLEESRVDLGFAPAAVESAVRIALELAGQPALRPTTHPEFVGQAVYDMPDFLGTWRDCLRGIEHKLTGERRPVTFDHDIASQRNDIVLLHLNHPLVQRALVLLRAEIWARDDQRKLERATIFQVPRGLIDSPVMLAWSRLFITGGMYDRLHEEITLSGGRIRQGRFARLNVGETKAIEDALRIGNSDKSTKQACFRLWHDHADSLVAGYEARSKDRLENLCNTIERRRTQEVSAIREVLNELRVALEKELTHEPEQIELFSSDEKDQLSVDKAALRRKLDALPTMEKEEVAAVERRYDNPVEHTFPVAVAFVLPEGWKGGDA